MPESLEELSFRAVSAVKDAGKASHKYTDFGEFLGLKDEFLEIQEEFSQNLHKACRRSKRLINRIELWESGKHDVTHL